MRSPLYDYGDRISLSVELSWFTLVDGRTDMTDYFSRWIASNSFLSKGINKEGGENSRVMCTCATNDRRGQSVRKTSKAGWLGYVMLCYMYQKSRYFSRNKPAAEVTYLVTHSTFTLYNWTDCAGKGKKFSIRSYNMQIGFRDASGVFFDSGRVLVHTRTRVSGEKEPSNIMRPSFRMRKMSFFAPLSFYLSFLQLRKRDGLLESFVSGANCPVALVRTDIYRRVQRLGASHSGRPAHRARHLVRQRSTAAVCRGHFG